jgi:acetate kinase
VGLAGTFVKVLVVNAGSSSLKLRLLDSDDAVVESADLDPDGSIVDAIGDWPAPDVVGHRVVHGGTEFTGPVRIDTTVRRRLQDLVDLAPLHQPKSLIALDAVSEVLPETPAVACFDTAFHATIAAAASTYAVPREWRYRYGIRRYGFHGLSHGYCARRAGELLGDMPRRMVTCHLGAGASLTAVLDGLSVDTTMGFTPLEGLVMATRSGTVDPGLVLWLEEHEKLRPRDVAAALEERSGLLALAGTPDMRQVEAAAAAGGGDARLALDVYVHRLVTGVGAMAAAAGGLDSLAFTGGVGERSPTVRRRAAEQLRYLGVAVDPGRNDDARPDADISTSGAPVRTLVIAAREDLEMARECRASIGQPGEPDACLPGPVR